MYILASNYEREISIHKITNPEHGILDVVRELYAQIRDLEGFDDENDINHLDINLDILFNNEDSHYEDNYENLQKLKYFFYNFLLKCSQNYKKNHIYVSGHNMIQCIILKFNLETDTMHSKLILTLTIIICGIKSCNISNKRRYSL